MFMSKSMSGFILFLSKIITGNVAAPFVSDKSKVKLVKLRDSDIIFTYKNAVSASLRLKDENTFLSSNRVLELVLRED